MVNQSRLERDRRTKDYHSYINHILDFKSAKNKDGSLFSEGIHLNETFRMVNKFNYMNSPCIVKSDKEKLELKRIKKIATFKNEIFKEFWHKIK